MIEINFVVPSWTDSFYLSAVYYAKWLDTARYKIHISRSYKIGMLNVKLNDMWNEFRRPSRAHVYILDTPQYYNDLYRTVPLQKLDPKYVFVASSWNLEMAIQYFPRAGIVPRLVHPLYLLYEPLPYEKKEYDLAFVGGTHPRKSFREFMQVCEELKLRCWWTGSYYKLSLYELIEKLGKTKFLWWLSKSEGFGLPLAEAQTLGIPAICLRAHTSLDYCDTGYLEPSLWVEPTGEDVRELPFGRHKIWLFDYNEAKRTIKEALSIGEEEYNRLSNKLREIWRKRIMFWAKGINDLFYEIALKH